MGTPFVQRPPCQPFPVHSLLCHTVWHCWRWGGTQSKKLLSLNLITCKWSCRISLTPGYVDLHSFVPKCLRLKAGKPGGMAPELRPVHWGHLRNLGPTPWGFRFSSCRTRPALPTNPLRWFRYATTFYLLKKLFIEPQLRTRPWPSGCG